MTKKLSLGVVVALLFLTAALTLIVTLRVFTKKYDSLVRDLPQRAGQYALLEEVDELVRMHYYGEINVDALSAAAGKGYLDGLADPYSAYLSSEEYAVYQKKNAEVRPGVGVETTYEEASHCLRVVRVEENSPAAGAGIAADDLILSVGGDVVSSDNQQQLSLRLQTEEKEPLALTLRRTAAQAEDRSAADTAEQVNGTGEFSVTLQCGFSTPSCTGEVRDGVGYIRISRFSEETDTLFGTTLDACLSAQISGLVIDVRNNDGGSVAAAAKMIDRIVPLATGGTGAIATEKNAAGETVALYAADAEAVHLPICVLINSRTGGAAELFACDLHDFGKAQLIGEPTMGHGTVQQAFELSNGDAVILTVSEIIPYLGESFHLSGITPDQVVPMSPADKDRLFSSDVPADTQYSTALTALLS